MGRQIFEGLKVADFSWAAAGPQVGRELAEHGATVIHVESHTHLDPLRTFQPFKDAKPGVDRGAFYCEYNTNKLSMSVDLTKPRGREVALKLVKWADIVTESMAPGAMADLGLDYESCRKVNPAVIYLSTSQQGESGPHHRFKGVGHHVNAVAGYCSTTGWPDSDPTMIFTAYSDYVAPWYSLVAIMGALIRRRKTGQGMRIEQSQLECGVSFLAAHLADSSVNGRNLGRRGNRDSYMSPHGVYPCRGADRWVAIAVRNEEEWQSFCDAMGSTGMDHGPQVRHHRRPKAQRGRAGQAHRRADQGLHGGAGDDHAAGGGCAGRSGADRGGPDERPAVEAPPALPGAHSSGHRPPLIPRAGLQALRGAVRHQEGRTHPGTGQ